MSSSPALPQPRPEPCDPRSPPPSSPSRSLPQSPPPAPDDSPPSSPPSSPKTTPEHPDVITARLAAVADIAAAMEALNASLQQCHPDTDPEHVSEHPPLPPVPISTRPPSPSSLLQPRPLDDMLCTLSSPSRPVSRPRALPPLDVPPPRRVPVGRTGQLYQILR